MRSTRRTARSSFSQREQTSLMNRGWADMNKCIETRVSQLPSFNSLTHNDNMSAVVDRSLTLESRSWLCRSPRFMIDSLSEGRLIFNFDHDAQTVSFAGPAAFVSRSDTATSLALGLVVAGLLTEPLPRTSGLQRFTIDSLSECRSIFNFDHDAQTVGFAGPAAFVSRSDTATFFGLRPCCGRSPD